MPAQPFSILIVDDSDAMRAFLHEIVATCSVAVYEAETGSEAVQLYRDLRPDLVLMDIRMPGMDGIEATAVIMAEHPDASIVMVTDHDKTVYRRDAANAGAKGYFLKERLHELAAFIQSGAASVMI